MDKRELLFKLNKMKTTHEINSLKEQVDSHKEEIASTKNSFKEAINQYDIAVRDSVEKLQNEIIILNQEKDSLQKENEVYKRMLNKIPRFIVKLFNKNDYKKLNKGENDG